MPAANKDFVMPSGGTLEFTVDIIDGPDSIENYVGSMQIRELRTDVEPLATVSPADIVVNHLTRQVTVRLPSEETALYTWRRGVYDLYITGPAGDAWRILEGRMVNSLSVTRGA